MQAHLALSCSKVPFTIKIEYLLFIKQNAEEQVTNSTSTVSKKRCVNLSQTRIDKFYESDQIDSTKQVLCDKAVAKFFIYYGVAFHLVSHPFFIDMVKSLCNGYEPPYSTTLSNTLMNNELTKITVDQQLMLDKESDLTLGPVKSAVKALEFKSTTLADCFVELIKLSQRINFLPPISDQNFKSTCIELFNKRWKQFDFDLYILSYILHPYY
ncbi:unnamed protein product [Rhizophagus irregularis]|nr:unnamed protein product [Rhizophagus irregularis]